LGLIQASFIACYDFIIFMLTNFHLAEHASLQLRQL